MKRVGYANVPNIETLNTYKIYLLMKTMMMKIHNVVCEYNSETKKWTLKKS